MAATSAIITKYSAQYGHIVIFRDFNMSVTLHRPPWKNVYRSYKTFDVEQFNIALKNELEKTKLFNIK